MLLLIVGAEETWYAIRIRNLRADAVAADSWPFKAIVPVACALLLIQGVSEVIKSLHAALTGIELEHKEKVEI